jgi:hypothetical protein
MVAGGETMSNHTLAMLQLDGLIAGVETNSSIPVQLSELKMLRVLLGGSFNEPLSMTSAPPPAA